MDRYSELINEINNYRNSEDVSPSSEVISIADLKRAVEYKFSGIKNAINNPELTKIKHQNLFSAIRICGIEKININPFGSLSIVVKLDLGFNNYTYVNVGRQRQSNKLFFDFYNDKRIKHVMEQAIPFFHQIFDEMESLENITSGMDHSYRSTYLSSDKLFQFFLELDSKYNATFSPLKLSYFKDADGIGDKTWLTRKTINEVIKENSDELCSKVPIYVELLPFWVKNAIYEYLEYVNSSKLTLHEGE